MMNDLRKNGLLIVAVVSLGFNLIAAVLLFQNYRADAEFFTEKLAEQQEPLDYENFKTDWGTAWIGINVSDVTPLQATQALLDRPEGAYVNSVENNSPAQKSGIKPGNIILSFNPKFTTSKSSKTITN